MPESAAELILAALVLVSGCNSDQTDLAPATSGGVVAGGLFMGQFTLHREGLKPRAWALNDAQLNGVSAWLKSHLTDCVHILASPPPPSLSIVLKHSDGTRTQVDLFDGNPPFVGWKNAVVVHRTDAAQNASCKPPDEDRSALLDLVREQGHPG